MISPKNHESALHRTHILIAEDDGIVAKDLELTLKEMGYEVPAVVSSGEAAIKSTALLKPDLVIMDVHLNGSLDGIDATATIRENHDLPVVFLTAYADRVTRERAMGTDPFGYLVKPFEEKELQSTIELALHKHQLEKKIRQAEQWLSAVIQSIGDAVVATDERNCVAFLNPVAENLTGWKNNDAAGLPVEDVVWLEQSGAEGVSRRNLSSEVPQVGEFRGPSEGWLVAKNGERKRVSYSDAPIWNQKQGVKGVVLVFRDISKRKQAEEALRASEERYRRLFEQDVVGNFVCDASGRIRACNRAFARIFGQPSAQALHGMNLRKVYQQGAEFDRLIGLVEVEKELEYAELELERVDGETVHVLANLVGTFDASGKMTQIHGHLMDITERKLLEERLAQGQRLEAIGRLAGGMAHDFNNLLMVTLCYCHLLLETTTDEDSRSCLEEIRKTTERASKLIRQLLAYSRKQILQPRLMDLNKVVNSLEGMIRPLLGNLVDLCFKLGSDVKEIRADSTQIEQILLNLAVNARDAMPSGGALLIETSEEVLEDMMDHEGVLIENGKYVMLSVTDTGEGIDPAVLQHIFDPYFTTKEQGKGTGLGLASVYGIVKQSGGHLQVRSIPGEGTRFDIYFPAASREMDTGSEQDRTERAR